MRVGNSLVCKKHAKYKTEFTHTQHAHELFYRFILNYLIADLKVVEK